MGYKYKNVSDYPQIVPEIGFFEAGEIKEVEEQIDNPNFVLVSEAQTPAQPQTEVKKEEVKPEVKPETEPVVTK